MSNVIRFLEVVGSKPMSAAEYAASVSLLEANISEREALWLEITRPSLKCWVDVARCIA